MSIIKTTGTTGIDGSLTLTLPLGQPLTQYEIEVVANPKGVAEPTVDPWARITAFRERLAASGRDFGDSVQDIREDRDR